MTTPQYQIPDEMLLQLQYRQLANALPSPVTSASGVGGALSNLYGATAGGRGVGSLGFVGGKAALGKAIPGVGVATLGPQLVNQIPGASRDVKDILGNTVAGAGLGAAGGAAFGGVGAVPGAVIGGTAGLVKGVVETFFGGDDEPPDPKEQLASAASQFGLDPAQYTAAYDLLSKSGADKKTLGAQLAQQLLQDAQAKKQMDAATTLQSQQRAGDQQFALAMQAQAAQFFTPYVNNIITAGQSQAELLKGQAADLPAPYRDVLLNQAQQAIGQSQRLAGAYAAQASMLPSQHMMSQDLKRQTELAQLQYQQSVVNAQSGGGQDFSALAQQLAGQTAG